MSDAIDLETAAKAITKAVLAGSGLPAGSVFWAYEGKPRPPAPYIVMSLDMIRGIGHDWVTVEDNPLVFADLTVTAVDTVANTLAIAAHPFGNGDGPIQLLTSGTLPAPLLASTDYWVIVTDAGHIQLAATFEQTGGQMPLGAGNPITPIDLTSAGSGTIQVVATANTLPAGKELIRHAEGQREVTIHFECFAVEGKGYDAVRILTNVIANLQLSVYDLDTAGVGISDFGQGYSQGGVRSLEGHRGSVLEPRSMVDITVYMTSNVSGFETIIAKIDGEVDLKTEGGATLPAIPVHIVAG